MIVNYSWSQRLRTSLHLFGSGDAPSLLKCQAKECLDQQRWNIIGSDHSTNISQAILPNTKHTKVTSSIRKVLRILFQPNCLQRDQHAHLYHYLHRHPPTLEQRQCLRPSRSRRTIHPRWSLYWLWWCPWCLHINQRLHFRWRDQHRKRLPRHSRQYQMLYQNILRQRRKLSLYLFMQYEYPYGLVPRSRGLQVLCSWWGNQWSLPTSPHPLCWRM